MKIAAVADIDIKKAQNFADEFKVSKAFGCPEDLAREPTVGMSFTLFFSSFKVKQVALHKIL